MNDHISACITAGNEEKNIRRCLESVKWANELVVVDSFSEDRTVEISREFTDRVYQHKWLGYIGQKNLIKDMAVGPWVLFIDADEEVSPALRDEIREAFQQEDHTRFAGFEFPRKVYYLDRWILHGDWYPDIKLRLFRKDLGTCGGREPLDRMTVDGPVRRLKSPIHHFTYDGIVDQINTLNRFSTITAETKYAEGQRCHVHDLLFRPMIRFARGYLLRRGFMDGLPGFIISMTTPYGVLIKYSKLWEIDMRSRHKR